MGFGEATTTCLKKGITFSGRASRSEYWWFMLFLTCIQIAAVFADDAIIGGESSLQPIRLVSIQALWLILFIVPDIAVGFRRFQDTGLAGWFYILLTAITYGPFLFVSSLGDIASLIAAFVTVLFFIRPSQPGTNQYGPNPNEVVS